MNIRSLIKGTLGLLVMILIVGSDASAQSNEQKITVTVRPAQTVEERVADEIKEKELRRAAEDKLAAEKSAQIVATSPKTLLGRARTFFVSSNTSFFESVQLQNALRKRTEFASWQMAVIDGWDKRNIADVLVEIDRPLFTYTFTYQIADRSTGIVLTSGKVTAFDSNAAAPKLATRIIDEIRNARGETKDKK